MSSSEHLSRQHPAPIISSSTTAPTILSAPVAAKQTPSSSSSSSPSFSSSTTTSLIPFLSKNRKSNNPLNIPEILELVLIFVLAQFQHSSHTQDSLAFPYPSSHVTTNDIQLQIRAQKPISTRLAFLRVCRLWYQVGEPLLWKNVKWADYQHPSVHLQIWNHWSRVRSLEFEYGKKTADTEPPSATPTTDASALETSNASSTPVTTSMNWANGPRARIRNLLGGTRSTSNQENPISNARVEDPAVTTIDRPKVTLDEALHDLAKTLSQPSNLPHYRPTPLPLRGTFLQTILPFLPELTSLDISLRCYEWRDEIRLDKVLRSCPKLQYLSVDRNMVGLVEFDDLPATSSYRGNSGNGQEESDTDDGEDDKDWDQDRLYPGTPWHLKYALSSYADNSDGSKPGLMAAQPSSAQFPLTPTPGTTGSTLDGKVSSDWSLGRSTRQMWQHPGGKRKQQRPLALRVLKLKKVRISEHDFVRLLRLCPLLEEMDVYSTIYWGWSRKFIETVSQSCPRVKHLHLTTNYNISGSDGIDTPAGGPMQAGLVIFHQTPPEQLLSQDNATFPGDANSINGYTNGDVHATSTPAANSDQEQPASTQPFNPVVELIKLYPALLSYDARYVRFQDRTLITLQQQCRQLESLDLTCCREITSKAINWFLRHVPTLKHFSGSRVLLRIEDLIESAEEHDRIVAANANIRANTENPSSTDIKTPEPRWWACKGLETFIIGLKNPVLPGSERDFDLQGEHTADYQYYYRDYQGSGSSSGGASGARQFGSGNKQYDHTQYCTFVLFEQLGRLRRLKRLELHGGRFDLGINLKIDSSYPPQQSSSLLMSSSKNQITSFSSSSDSESGSRTRRGLSRIKNFTLGGSIRRSKQKMDDESAILDPKNKGKSKANTKDKDKGKDKGKFPSIGGSCDTHYSEFNEQYRLGPSPDNTRFNHKIVPSHLRGLQPLMGLSNLKSFSMVWSVFPMLREQEIAWICQNWISLEWVSLGLVPECEWNRIKNWVHSRRSDVVVVFEK
ncbi:hypothetical protein BGX21_000942 [Mortierella sp. AD011]|nr:hypothetical protein BGX21_000942 [Mortierella sp. AD011]